MGSEGFINACFELSLWLRGGNKVSTTHTLFCSQVGQRRRSVSTGTCDINQGPCRSQGHVEVLSVLPPSILVFCHLSKTAERGRWTFLRRSLPGSPVVGPASVTKCIINFTSSSHCGHQPLGVVPWSTGKVYTKTPPPPLLLHFGGGLKPDHVQVHWWKVGQQESGNFSKGDKGFKHDYRTITHLTIKSVHTYFIPSIHSSYLDNICLYLQTNPLIWNKVDITRALFVTSTVFHSSLIFYKYIKKMSCTI